MLPAGLWDVLKCEQDTHGHGPPDFLAKTDLNLRAGPNFIPSELVRWSSVSNGSPVPSILCSRKFWNKR